MTVAPVRLQLSRAKGFRLQDHSRAVNGLPAVNCARPTVFGNPFRPGVSSIEEVVWQFRRAMTTKINLQYARVIGIHKHAKLSVIGEARGRLHELASKNLACWCPLDRPCHVDVLLELANREITT